MLKEIKYVALFSNELCELIDPRHLHLSLINKNQLQLIPTLNKIGSLPANSADFQKWLTRSGIHAFKATHSFAEAT